MNNFPLTPVRPSSIAEPFVPGTADAFLAEYLEYWAQVAPDSEAHTFIDYAESRQGVSRTLTYAELEHWTRAVAARLMQVTMPGDRVALLVQQGTEFVVGFLGALRTQAINVPLFAPDMPGQGDRLWDGVNVGTEQDQVGGFVGDVGGLTDGNAQISLFERRSVVGAVTHERHFLAALLHEPDGLRFALGADPGEDVGGGNTRLRGNRRRRPRVVAREEVGFQTGGMERLNGFCRAGFDCVAQGDQGRSPLIDGHPKDRRALIHPFLGECGSRLRIDVAFFEPGEGA